MTELSVSERPMTEAEFARMNMGFEAHTIAHGNPVQVAERFGFVAQQKNAFVGCSSGLAYKNGLNYSPWFYLTDLFVEQAFRGRGLGAILLNHLEQRVALLGLETIWTWTAGYEAPGFYQKQGYTLFCELENFYATGHSRIALRKPLRVN